jgi:putative ABC transport system ATP-binding protein
MVFQQFHLIRGLTVRANIAVPLIPYGLSHSNLKKSVEQAAENAGIAHKMEAPIEKLSGGEQQRVAIARALAANPTIIFADEPTAHLDSHTATAVLDVFTSLKASGKTIIITSHDLLVQQHPIVNKRLFIKDGRLTDENQVIK